MTLQIILQIQKLEVGFRMYLISSMLRLIPSVRLLGLVAALLSFDSTFKAAQGLHILLKESAINKQELPPVEQLKDLIISLERRIACSGFAESLVGWKTWAVSPHSGLRDLFLIPNKKTKSRVQPNVDSRPGAAQEQSTVLELSPSVDVEEQLDNTLLASRSLPEDTDIGQDDSIPLLCEHMYPDGNLLSRIIAALSELERLGEATLAIIKIPATLAIWTIAFVKWCLGSPPSLRRHHDGVVVLKQPGTEVIIDIATAETNEMLVQTFKIVNGIDE